MNSRRQSPTGPDAVEQTRKRLHQLVAEIARQAQAAQSPPEFYAAFLQRVLEALDAPAGAVWGCTPQGELSLQYQINLEEVGLDDLDGARACHDALLRQVVRQGRSRVVAPHSGPGATRAAPAPANLTPYVLLLAPVLLDEQVAAVIQVWQEPRAAHDPSLQFLGSMADLLGGYLRNARLRELEGQQQLWNQLETYAQQIHGSLDPREAAYVIAHEGRRLIGCDRVSVAVRRGRLTRVEAVSGVDVIEKRSPLVRAMRTLCDRVLEWGETLHYTGVPDPSLPPAVLKALDAYLSESNSKMLTVVPLHDEREKQQGKPGRAALLAECFDPGVEMALLEGRLEVVARHATSALYNAVEYRRIPFRWLWQALAGIHDHLRGKRLLRTAALAAALALLTGALVVVRCPLRMNATGQLLPTQRQLVFAPVQGKIVQMRVQHGDRVDRGQELLLMENLELQQKVKQLEVRKAAAEDHITALNERLNQTTSDEERHTLKLEEIKQRYERRKAEVERDLLLQQAGKPLETPVVAPRAGTVVTFDTHEQLLGKTVKPGDPLLRLAGLNGPWEIELRIPEQHIAPVREALAHAPAGVLKVDLLLASQPERTYQGWLHADGLGGETAVQDNRVVVSARVEIDDPGLVQQLGGMPVGAEVRGKVHCGSRAVGYVWFHDLWEFFYEHVLF